MTTTDIELTTVKCVLTLLDLDPALVRNNPTRYSRQSVVSLNVDFSDPRGGNSVCEIAEHAVWQSFADMTQQEFLACFPAGKAKAIKEHGTIVQVEITEPDTLAGTYRVRAVGRFEVRTHRIDPLEVEDIGERQYCRHCGFTHDAGKPPGWSVGDA
jgi:hypothetical protein